MFINETLSMMLAILPGNITYTKNLFEANQFPLMKKYFSRKRFVFTTLRAFISAFKVDTEFHNICKIHGINLVIVIGSTEESVKWIHQEVSTGQKFLRGQDKFSPTT